MFSGRRTVGNYLSLWGLTPQTPLRTADELRPADVHRWLDETYPAIKAQADTEPAEICWGKETGRRKDGPHDREDARQGKTPLIRLTAHPVSTHMISGVSTQGTVRFQVFEGTMNADLLMGFCRRLMTSAQRQMSWVRDHVRVHPAQVFQAWRDDHRDDMEGFYRPADSPEVNPDESFKCESRGTPWQAGTR